MYVSGFFVPFIRTEKGWGYVKDVDYMKLALKLAEAGKGQTSPNPAVGAVVVANNTIVGVGSHVKAGEDHAEVHALNMAKSKARAGTIYVTLEPCSHYGKTPPCAELIVQSGIKRAVIATYDPNPQVCGKGVHYLEQAGIEVDVGIKKAEADRINEDFYHYIKTKMPFITLKTAVTLDGKIATSTGESKWITGREAREDVHQYRHEHDAILVGIGTVLKDNPKLTTRLPQGGKSPIRIILDSDLRTPIDAHVITDNSVETWIVTGNKVSKHKKQKFGQEHVTLIEVDNPRNLHPLMLQLGKLGIVSLFVEGGATVNDSFLTQKLVNQIVLYMAPILIGGSRAPTSFEGDGIASLQNALKVQFESVQQIGHDLKIIAKPRPMERGKIECLPE